MRISETTLFFLESDCRQIFGEPDGTIIFQQTEKVYQELLHSADDRGSAAIREHLQLKLFPPMAYYKALRANGFCQEEALSYVRRETQRAAAIKKEQMGKLARLPFAYTLYRMGAKKHMKKNFPDEGWQTEWVRCDGQEIHFNLRRCIYQDVTSQFGCPELCGVYCENDDIAFSGLMPKIRFERTGTLGDGADCCDFHFIKWKSNSPVSG